MIGVKNLFKFLNQNGIKFFSGVPDSILKNINFSSVAIKYKFDKSEHIVNFFKNFIIPMTIQVELEYVFTKSE